MHVLTLTEAWSALKETIATGLESQAKLLEGIDYDLDSISQLSVHPEFLALNSNRRNGVPATPTAPGVERDVDETRGEGVKTKMLGEYVSRPKMKVVVESCRKIHGKCPNGPIE
jgi:autophagy-related protein 11